ncbi:MAG: NADH-quinone oxidoreductase subunit C [Pirellulaceae bacterium]
MSDLVSQLKEKFGDGIVDVNTEMIDDWIEVTPDALLDICEFLAGDSAIKLDMLNCITAVDYLQTDPKKAAKADFEPHMQVVYHLSSIEHKHTLVLKVKVDRWKNGEEGSLPEVPSVAGIWRTADWHEREVYDLSGVLFTGHPNMKRILCPDDWVGYPLRKDYEMPLEYHGIRGR